MTAILNGTVVLASKRGYMFVADDETGVQYFLHASAVVGRVLLKSGDRVQFELDYHPQGRNRVRAANAVRMAPTAVVEKDSRNEIKQQPYTL